MTEFNLKILTPEGVAYDGMVQSVIVRTTVGDKGIHAKHEPYVAALVIGQMKVRTADGVRIGAVSSGMVEVNDSGTTVLAQSFEWADEIDVERANRALKIAEERMKQYKDDKRKLDIAEYKLKRAINRINTASDYKR